MPELGGISDMLESASEMTFDDIFDLVFRPEGHMAYWVILSIYLCYYFRKSASPRGTKWYRSLIVGFLIIYMPRYVFSSIIHRSITELQDYTVWFVYLGIWCAFNICPFDIVFAFCNRFSTSLALSIVEAHIEAIVTINQLYNITETFTSDDVVNFEKIIFVQIFILFIPFIIQSIDAVISQDYERDFVFPIAHIKRISALSILIIFFTQKSSWVPEPAIDFYHIVPVMSVFCMLARFFDYLYYDFYNFKFLDLVLPALNDGTPAKLEIPNLLEYVWI